MAEIIAGIVSIARAIPAVRDIVNRIFDEWHKSEIESWDKSKRDAYRKLLDEHDQRDLEKAIGNPKAGKPSGDEGAVIRPGKPPTR